MVMDGNTSVTGKSNMADYNHGGGAYWGAPLEKYNIHALKLIWKVVLSATKIEPLKCAAITLRVMDSVISENKKWASLAKQS
jgi:hypothetical protein